MRRAVTPLLLVLLALAVGCGGGDGDAAATETVEEDARPPGRVLQAFVEAAAAGDAEGMWALLSSDTRERLGGSLEAFREGSAAELEAEAGALGAGDPRLVLEEALGADLAVATVATGSTAYAAPLWLEDAGWRVSVGGGPRLVPRTPEPGTTVDDVSTVRFGVSTGELDEAVAWLDDSAVPGLVLEAESITGAPGLSPGAGTHVVTALAVAAGQASAVAWTFEVR